MDISGLRVAYEGHTPTLMGERGGSAVLVPLVRQNGEYCLLYEIRSAAVRQPGEVCFPGGKREPGETAIQCALRETEEELSIPPSAVTVLGTPDFICNQMGFLLRPVLGLVSPAGFAALRPSPAEVAEAFTAPLSFFAETAPEPWRYELVPQVPEDFPYESVGIPRDYSWNHGWVDVPVWYWQGHAVWGMTARLVQDLIKAL